MPIRPNSKLKSDGTGGQVDNIHLRRWFFCYIRMASGSTLQQFGHALEISASNHANGDFDRALSIRKVSS